MRLNIHKHTEYKAKYRQLMTHLEGAYNLLNEIGKGMTDDLIAEATVHGHAEPALNGILLECDEIANEYNTTLLQLSALSLALYSAGSIEIVLLDDTELPVDEKAGRFINPDGSVDNI